MKPPQNPIQPPFSYGFPHFVRRIPHQNDVWRFLAPFARRRQTAEARRGEGVGDMWISKQYAYNMK